ncbi:MAG: hypothetical protein H7338_13395 [Candidatus Sericytochromatia bacterium]|nr:hypothetical protein [Candidatus Sericytochromatia bacterium]
MDVKTATALAEQFFSKPDDKLRLGDKRLDVSALALIDTNQDYHGDKQELIDAFVADRVKVSDGKIIPANAFGGTSLSPRTPNQNGIAPASWVQAPTLVGGDPANAPGTIAAVSRFQTATPANAQSNFSSFEMTQLAGKDFTTLKGQLKSPADIAFFLETNITYDDKRLTDSEGNYGSWSSDETLKRGTGVCRDQHALARDLLIANGHEATLLGYAASDQSHAVTAYQDKSTGKWGILEYGKLYPPAQLQANSPEEALLMVRPNTLAITQFNSDGPGKESHVTGMLYTRASRVYEQFMLGPSPDAGTGVTATNTGISASVASNDRRWQAGMKVVTDPRLPYLQGAVMVGAWRNFVDAGVRVGVGGGYVPHNVEHMIGSNRAVEKAMGFAFVAAEEFHPDLISTKNIGGSGINVKVGSHTTAQLMVGTKQDQDDKTKLDIEGTSLGVSSLKWNPTITADRSFSLWNKGTPDTRAHVGYGMGVDAGLLGGHYVTGGRSLPINQYLVGGFETMPNKSLSLSVKGYVPLQNVTNDFNAKPLLRLDVATPYIRVGTSQAAGLSRYDISSGVNLGKHVNIAAYGAFEQDRTVRQSDFQFGARLTVASF